MNATNPKHYKPTPLLERFHYLIKFPVDEI
jgi:hypothetical protein